MKKWLLCLPALCLAGCLSDGAERGVGSVETERPGHILFVRGNALGKAAAAQPASADVVEFTLDTTKSSFSQYFTLQNTGDLDVTGIDLVTDNPNVVFSPSHIDVLPSHAKSSWSPVIELKITHGARLGADGWGGLLPMGKLAIKASASGKTSTAAGEALQISENVTLNTYVKVADVDLLDGGTSVDLFHPAGNLIGPSSPVSEFVPYYFVSDGAGLRNTGNTPVKIRFFSGTVAVDSVVAGAGDTVRVGRSTVEIDAGGVVSDVFKLRRVSDGRIFLVLRGPIQAPPQ